MIQNLRLPVGDSGGLHFGDYALQLPVRFGCLSSVADICTDVKRYRETTIGRGRREGKLSARVLATAISCLKDKR